MERSAAFINVDEGRASFRLNFRPTSVVARAARRARGVYLVGRERWRRCRRRRALRYEPKLEGVRVAVAAVDEAHAVCAKAARGRQIIERALAHAVCLARATVAPRVGDDVAGRAGVVLKLYR